VVSRGDEEVAREALQLPAVQFINDDELLALFPNRPVALIGEPGKQRLVFLDRQNAPELEEQELGVQ